MFHKKVYLKHLIRGRRLNHIMNGADKLTILGEEERIFLDTVEPVKTDTLGVSQNVLSTKVS